MKIQKVQVTGAKGSTVDCGYFSNALYDTYLQLTTTAEIGKQYNIHGYIKSNRSGTIRCQDMTANVTTSWQEIKMIIIPTSNILELYFYPGEFYLYNWKLFYCFCHQNTPISDTFYLLHLICFLHPALQPAFNLRFTCSV